MRTKSFSLGRPIPSGLRSGSLWDLFVAICKNAMSWHYGSPEFACEFCGDLVTLERAKLRDEYQMLH